MLTEKQAVAAGLPPMELIPAEMQPFAMFTMDDDDGNPLWSVDWNKAEMAREASQDDDDHKYIEKVCRQARLDAMADHYQNQGNIDNETSYFTV